MSLLTTQNGRAAFAGGTDLGLPDWLGVMPDDDPESGPCWLLNGFALGRRYWASWVFAGDPRGAVETAVDDLRYHLQRTGALP